MTTSKIYQEPAHSLRSLIAPLSAIVLGMMMVILDSTAVNVAITSLVTDLNAPLTTLQWTITGYMLAMAAIIPLAGWLSDRFGAKKVFLTTVILFTLGSILCSMAQTAEQLIIFRLIQGLGGGMVQPLGMAMVFRLAPPGKKGRVMGLLGIPMLLAPASGPVLSGWLLEVASWHWIFLINLPIGIIALLLGLRYLPASAQSQVHSLDIKGMLLAPIAFTMLTYGVSQGKEGWTAMGTLIGLLVGGIALILFVIVELHQEQPLLELRIFSSPSFTKGVLISWIMLISLNGSMVFIPLYLQQVKGYSPLATGLIMSAQAITSGVFMPIGGHIFDKFGVRPLAMSGLSVIAGALFLLSAITQDTGLIYVIITLSLLGTGMGLAMMSLNTHNLQSAPSELVSRVTPLTSATAQVVISFAVAGLTGYLSFRTTYFQSLTEDSIAASIAAFGNTFLLTACIAVFGALLSLILRKPQAVNK